MRRLRLVVEADGGSRGNPGPAGYGAVVLRRRPPGEVLAEAAEYIGVATNNVAEYRGLIAGLRAARALDPDADGPGPDGLQAGRRADVGPLEDQAPRHEAARGGGGRGPRRRTGSRYEWIPRAQNKHADRLANEAMDAGKRGEQWEPSAPPRPTFWYPPLQAPAPRVGGLRAAPRRHLGTPATFVLLRHGETALTPEKRFSGSGGTDPELSATGRAQAGLPRPPSPNAVRSRRSYRPRCAAAGRPRRRSPPVSAWTYRWKTACGRRTSARGRA